MGLVKDIAWHGHLFLRVLEKDGFGAVVMVGNSLIVLAAAIIVVGQKGVLLDMILNVDRFKRRGRIDRPKGSKRLRFMKGNGIDVSAIKLSIRIGIPKPADQSFWKE